MEVPLREGPQVLPEPLVGRRLSTLWGAGLDLDLGVPLRRRLLAGVAGAGVAASPTAVLFSSVTVSPGTAVPASSKSSFISFRLLDFYRGGTLIASPCRAESTGLPCRRSPPVRVRPFWSRFVAKALDFRPRPWPSPPSQPLATNRHNPLPRRFFFALAGVF